MKLKELFKASILYVLVTLVFFYKVFFGLIPLPSDMIMGSYFPWLAYEKGTSGLGVPVKNPKLSDAISIFYPLKDLAHNQVKRGERPLWNPHMFGGYPLYTSPTLGLLFPTSILYFLLSTPLAWTLQTMLQPFLGCLFMYLFLRHLKINKTPSFFGGLVYGFGGFSLLWLQWNGQATTSIFLPLILLFFDKYLKTKLSKWGIALSSTVFSQILAGYLPVISLTYVVLLFWYLYFSEDRTKDLKVFFYILLGVFLSSFFLIPLGELILLSQRTAETLSYSPFILLKNLVNTIAPDFYGNPATYNYWGTGDQMDATLYVGVTSLVFAIFATWKLRSKNIVRFCICLFILIMVLATENPIGKFVYGLGVWGGSSITMNRANFIFNFIIATLSAYGISHYRQKKFEVRLKPAFLVIYLFAFLGIGVLIYKASLYEFIDLNTVLTLSDQENVQITHLNIALRNLVWPTFIGVTTTIALLMFSRVKKIKKHATFILIVILLIDLFRFGWKFNTFSRKEYIYPDTPVTDFLKRYPNDRLISESDVLPPNMWIPLGLSSISGYDSIYPLRAAKLIAVANSGNVDASPQPRWGTISTTASPILDASGVRFFVALKRDGDAQVRSEGDISLNHDVEKYKEVFEDKGVVILENEKVMTRSYMTNKVIKRSDREALELMISDDFDISKTSITNDFELSMNEDLELKHKTNYHILRNDYIVVNTSANQNAFLVVLDSYYPGWKAYVDGKETKIHRTNYNFRGVLLDKGEHVVEFTYQPRSLRIGMWLSGATFLILMTIFLYDLKKNSRRTSRKRSS
ncbi:YfhO family protein [Candidatus Woesebacteria bacterium]|nr:YfhO family protein [Candidatus Woesebacteria bacterium]